MYRIFSSVFAAVCLAALLVAVNGCDDKTDQPVPASGGDINPQYSEDIRMYEQALSTDPDNKDILIQLGNLYFDMGEAEARAYGDTAQPVPKWLKAVDYYGRALAMEPDNVNVRTDMAILLNWMGRLDDAEKEFRTGIKTDPKHAQARINLIVLLGGSMGRYADAVKEYDSLIMAVPEQKDNTALKAAVDDFRQKMKEAKR